MAMAERAEAMRRMPAALVARRDRIAALIIAEVGCAQAVTGPMQVDAPIAHLLSAIDHSTRDDSVRLPVEAVPTR